MAICKICGGYYDGDPVCPYCGNSDSAKQNSQQATPNTDNGTGFGQSFRNGTTAENSRPQVNTGYNPTGGGNPQPPQSTPTGGYASQSASPTPGANSSYAPPPQDFQPGNNQNHTSLCCPRCGSKNLHMVVTTDVHTKGKDFSGAKGCLGYLIFGPLGILCGLCGQNKKTTTTNKRTWTCGGCGNQFDNPQDLRDEVAQYKKSSTAMIIVFGILSVLGISLGASIASATSENIFFLLGAAPCFMLLIFLGVRFLWVPKNQHDIDELENSMKKFK